MRKAAIYTRKSKFTSKGESINNQIQFCKDYLLKRDKDYGFLIYEDEGFSGKSTDRPQFKEMLKDAKAKAFDVLICYRLDRVSRNIADFARLIQELEKYNISFISVNEQFDTSNPMGRAMMYIASVFAQLERETIAERIRDNMLELSKTGRWLGGTAPTGYESMAVTYLDSEMNERKLYRLSSLKDELDLVKLIFNKYIEFKSLSKLAKYLLINNMKTKKNTFWTCSKLKCILENPVYVQASQDTIQFIKESSGAEVAGIPDGIHGILTYNKRRNKTGPYRDSLEWIYAIGDHEGIIPSESWIKVQELLKANKLEPSRLGKTNTAMLTGILKCGICGENMKVTYGSINPATGKRHYYYTCSRHYRSDNLCCNNKSVRGDILESSVISELNFVSIDHKKFNETLKNYKYNSINHEKVKELKNSIIKNDRAISNLLDNLSLAADKDTSKLILSKIGSLNIQNKKLQEELDGQSLNISQSSETVHDINNPFNITDNFISIMHSLSLKEKKLFLNSIIENAYWYGSKNELVLKLLDLNT